jgi:peptide/nickel transport system permease protein
MTAGYRGGKVEGGIMRLADLLLALPALLVLIVVAGAFSGGYVVAVALLAFLAAPWDTRIIRAATLEQRHRPYVEAASVMGLTRRRTLLSHILPNVVPVIVVNMSLDFAFGLVALSGLTFLGLGVPPGTPDWGRMLSENQSLLTVSPLAELAPALAILLTAAAASLVGDWTHERLAVPG